MSSPQPRIEDEAYAEPSREAAPPLVALPRRLTPFFRRQALVERVVERIQDPNLRILTLTGPGGVGKTRLALHVAQVARAGFLDGTSFVSLAPVVDPALVLPEIGRSLGLTDGGERPINERLADALSGRHLLLVLDNMEQVLSVAPRIAELLQATDGLTVLATSRAPLQIDGEHELAVPPLTVPAWSRAGAQTSETETEAVGFFLERARAVNPALALSPSGAAAVGAIVRKLDGLPLALELAAARTKALSPEALLVRLERQLHVLTGGPQDRPERQRTMRNAIAWSYGLLDPAEQALFRWLAVFRGGFSLEDAEAVLSRIDAPAADEPDVLDGVTALVNQSLLVATDHNDGEARFRMLETIREFGLERLSVAGEADATQRGFAAHWHALAEASWAHASELDALNWALAPLERNHDNVRAALDWLEEHDPAGAADFAGSLSWFWYVKGHHEEALRRLRRLLSMPESDVPLTRRPRLLLGAGWSAHFQGDTDSAVPYLERALDLWRAQGDSWGTGFTLFVLGLIAEDTGEYDRARPLLNEAIDHLAAAGDVASVASARFHLAVVAFGVGDIDVAEALLHEVLGPGLGSSLRIAGWALHLRGLLAHRRGDLAASLRDQQEALRRFHAVGSATGIAETLAGVAVAAGAAGLPVAVRCWAVAERMAEERGDAFHQPERAVYEATVRGLRASLGEALFEAERATGRTWTEDEAVTAALALELTPAPIVSAPSPGGAAALTGREVQVLRLVAEGWTNDRIGEELFLSPRTVQTHLTNIFRKFGVDNRAEAVRTAVDLTILGHRS